jgi:hypothetical protein
MYLPMAVAPRTMDMQNWVISIIVGMFLLVKVIKSSVRDPLTG